MIDTNTRVNNRLDMRAELYAQVDKERDAITKFVDESAAAWTAIDAYGAYRLGHWTAREWLESEPEALGEVAQRYESCQVGWREVAHTRECQHFALAQKTGDRLTAGKLIAVRWAIALILTARCRAAWKAEGLLID